MTEAGEKWVADVPQRHWEQCHALSRRAAEFWIRAFCAEVKKVADERYPKGIPFGALGKAFDDLERELLG